MIDDILKGMQQENEAIKGKVQQSVSAPMSSLRPCCACGVWNLILGWLARSTQLKQQ